MIKTYEEALQKLNDIRDYLKIARADECVEELDSVAKYFINERKQPTLEEVKKEWEERGFIVNNNEFYIFLHHEQYGISMFINKKEKKYHVYSGYISLKLNELLTKTFRALDARGKYGN